MCGIAGYSCFEGKVDKRLDVALVLLGMHMQDRGRQAWGWTDGTQIVKATGSFQSRWNASFYGFPKAAIHTRYGTTGANTEENAHPWKIGGLIGMHNGVVHNHDELNKKYDRKCTVDSQHIFHHIAEGLDLNEIRAYGAIAFFKDGDLHIGRFNGGDLMVVRTNVGWFYASTRTALEEALRFSGLEKENPIYFRLKEERCYRLTDKKVLLVTDIKLNVGSYSRSWRSWEDGAETRPSQGYYRTGTGNTSGAPSGHPGYHNNGYNVTDRRRIQGALSSGSSSDDKEEPQQQERQTATSKRSKGKETTGTDAQTVDSGSGASSNLTLAEKVTNLVRASMDGQKKNPITKEAIAEPTWKCGYCQQPIANGQPAYLSMTCELACETCGIRYVEDMQGGPFEELPLEIVLVDSMFKPEDTEDHLDCDSCSDGIYKGEYFIETKENDFVCVQCFLDRDFEKKAEHEVEVGAEDDEDNGIVGSAQEAEESYYRELAEKYNLEERKALNRGSTPTPPVRVVPRTHRGNNIGPEPLMNEAECLKRFGCGVPPNFRSRLLN